MRRFGLILSFGLFAACGEGAREIHLAPPASGERANLIAVDRGGAFDVYAFDGGASLEPIRVDPNEVDVYAVVLERSLSALGIEEGRIEDARLDRGAVPVGSVRASARLRLEMESEDQPVWRAIETLPTRLADFHVTSNRDCPEFQVGRAYEYLDDFEVFYDAVGIRDGYVALFGSVAGDNRAQMRIWTTDGSMPYVLESDGRGPTYDGLYDEARDRLFVTSARGLLEVSWGDVLAGVDDVETSTAWPRPGPLVGGRRPDGAFEMFGRNSQQLAVREGNAWVRLDARIPSDYWNRRIDWIGPDHLFVGSRAPETFEMKDGVGRQFAHGLPAFPRSATHVAGIGSVVGTQDGTFYTLEGEAWVQIGDARYGWWALDVTPYRDGFAFLLASGTVGTYSREWGFCEPTGVAGTLEGGRLLATGDELVVLAEGANDAFYRMYWLRSSD